MLTGSMTHKPPSQHSLPIILATPPTHLLLTNHPGKTVNYHPTLSTLSNTTTIPLPPQSLSFPPSPLPLTTLSLLFLPHPPSLSHPQAPPRSCLSGATKTRCVRLLYPTPTSTPSIFYSIPLPAGRLLCLGYSRPPYSTPLPPSLTFPYPSLPHTLPAGHFLCLRIESFPCGTRPRTPER